MHNQFFNFLIINLNSIWIYFYLFFFFRYFHSIIYIFIYFILTNIYFILSMSNIAKLEFTALDISGKNYLSWILDAEIHLDAKGLGDTIKQGNQASNQDRAKAMIFLRHHIHEGLKSEYLTVKDPLVLWNNLKERYDHQKTVILPKARYDWLHLRLQDFKSVSEYNSALFRISSQLILCGEKITDHDKLEKTFSTFHASNVVLQQQYRERGFKKYSELISCLLVAEQNNELLMRNHEARPTGSAPFPEANGSQAHLNKSVAFPEANAISYGQRQEHNRRGRGRGRNKSRGNRNSNRGGYRNTPYTKNGRNNERRQDNPPSNDICHRCGGKGHWVRTCRTPRHLVDLYQASLKNGGKHIETNFAFNDGLDDKAIDVTHLDVADFFSDPNENIDHLIGNGNPNA